jgi:hypothetical protein
MADFYPVLSKAVAGLQEQTPSARRAIYDRARQVLVAQLRNVTRRLPKPKSRGNALRSMM